jgi:hypothetical protein
MPIIKPAFIETVTSEVAKAMQSVSGVSPLAQPDPSYFKEMCKGFATGIADGISTLQFETKDAGLGSAPPIPGTGAGVGIKLDTAMLIEFCYTECRNGVIEKFGETAHDPFPPSSGNSGEFLQALIQGIIKATEEAFKSQLTLSSNHPMVYLGAGKILQGKFSGLQAADIADKIVAASPNLKGKAWKDFCLSFGKGFIKGVHEGATSEVVITGVCVPSVAQICAIPMTGQGQGTVS